GARKSTSVDAGVRAGPGGAAAAGAAAAGAAPAGVAVTGGAAAHTPTAGCPGLRGRRSSREDTGDRGAERPPRGDAGARCGRRRVGGRNRAPPTAASSLTVEGGDH